MKWSRTLLEFKKNRLRNEWLSFMLNSDLESVSQYESSDMVFMRRLRNKHLFVVALVALTFAVSLVPAQDRTEKLYREPIDVRVPSIATDKAISIDYDIVYVRAPRAGDNVHKRFFTDFSSPITMEPGADLMLLHPDGSEELLVSGGKGSVTDPVVSLDGEWVYYVRLHNMVKANQWNPPKEGADIYKIHLKTRKIVKLTNQQFSPNLGAANWSRDFRTPQPGKSHFEYGVYNMGPCPLPGGRIAFTSNRDGFRPAKGYPAVCLQLFVMDDRDTDLGDHETPANLDKIGHLNLAGALHPVVLSDGRIMYSTLESQGARSDILWGIWTIHPDGTNWNPLVSAFDPGSAPNGFHFQTQLSNGSIVVEEYYNQNNSGFGAYILLPSANDYGDRKPKDYPAFASANQNDPGNPEWRFGRYDNGKPRNYRMPFMPTGSISLTPFSTGLEGPADRSILGDKTSPAVGKFTHPSAAPDNHLLTCYTPGPANHQYTYLPQIDGGLYLIKNGSVVNQPSEMRLIKNDPNFNECWPRAVVPYKRIHGIDEPRNLPPLANNGRLSKYLPEGTPYALIGSSSFYKRESYPNGGVPVGHVTSTFMGKHPDPWKGLDAFTSHGNGMPLNWHNQGADAGLYENSDIHAVRILAMEPTSDRKGANSGRRYHSHAGERLRIMGEIPLRKFNTAHQALDPDGQPDTSFLAKIPADLGFTFQTLDRHGMVLNSAQTWHQLRPGEVRTNCGGCHAHSQKGTEFKETRAGQPDSTIWDLTQSTPLLTEKAQDQSQSQWDVHDLSGLKTDRNGAVSVEYWRDIKPILKQNCVRCHTSQDGKTPAAKLDLDADEELIQYDHLGKFPGTYFRLALDERARFGFKPVGWDSWGYPNASRYVRKFQSRRSLLVWKVFGARLDGFQNDDHPSEDPPGSGRLMHQGQPIDIAKHRARFDLDYLGKPMPYDGNPLTDEQRRTIARWIDLGCPIDLDYDPEHPQSMGFGWMLDDQRPTLTLTLPRAGSNSAIDRIVIGMQDSGSGLDLRRFRVTANFAIDGISAGENLASQFQSTDRGIWQWKLKKTVQNLTSGRLTIEVADKQGNVTRIERSIQIRPAIK